MLAADALQWNDYLTILLGIWGAGLSTYLGLKGLQRDKRRLLLYAQDEEDEDEETGQVFDLVAVKVVNEGFRPIQLYELGIIVELDGTAVELPVNDPRPDLPRKLEDGDAVSGYWLVEHLSEDWGRYKKVEFKSAYAKGAGDAQYTGKFRRPSWLERKYKALSRRRRARRRAKGRRGGVSEQRD